MMSKQPNNLNALDYKGFFFGRAKGFYNTLLKVYFSIPWYKQYKRNVYVTIKLLRTPGNFFS